MPALEPGAVPPLDPAANRLDGRVAVITGTGGGQGRAAAVLFAAAGARVVGCDLKADGAQQTVDAVREAGGEMVSLHPCDLSAEHDVRALVDLAIDTYGGIDILYNNAGAARFAPVGEMSFADWRATLTHELEIVFTVTQACWPRLRASPAAVVLNTTSVAAHRGFGHLPGLAHVAAKGGVLALTRQLAAEGAPHGIRVNSISPGPVLTPASQDALGDPDHAGYVVSGLLVKRLGEPADVAQLALYLASGAAAWVSGTDVVIDGGRMAIA